MFTVYSIHDGKLEKMSKLPPQSAAGLRNVWVNVVAPTPEDVEKLVPLIQIPDEVITDVRDVNEVPKLDKIGEALYILVQTPLATSGSTTVEAVVAEYTVTPLAMLMTERCFVTVSGGKNDVIDYLEKKLKNIANNRLVDTNEQPQFVAKLMLFTAKIYLRYLKEIYNRLQIPLSEHGYPKVDKEIVDLLKIEQSLVYFDASLRSNYIVMEKTARRPSFRNPLDQELIDDAIDEMRQALEMAKVYGHIVEDIRHALSSLISNNLAHTVNWLTKVTVILMLPTLVGTLYGMNVPLPFAHSRFAFLIVIGISLLVASVGIWWVRRVESSRLSARITSRSAGRK